LPRARSVLVFAVPIPRGVVHAGRDALDLYWRFCSISYRALDKVVHGVCGRLEADGALATPVYSCFPQKHEPPVYRGLVPLVYLGEAAGIGRLTRSGMLAHPDHGLRILLAGAVTSAELEPAGVRGDDPCPADCDICMKACPVTAIDTAGKVDHEKCIRRANRNPTFWHLVRDRETRDKYPVDTLLNTVGADDHATYECNACLAACPLSR
jgi:epoxyqueuosine reductase QueG